MNIHYFHFTLGPVQGFVAQARRTRDFWAGSFLLSWLSAVAIKATEKQGGTILFPKANQTYLNFVEGEQKKGKEPLQGSIPNRFKAEVNSEFKAEKVTEAVQQAWQALADYIWEQDILFSFGDDNPILDIPGKIWDRQIPCFWDMTWVISDSVKNSSALDERKNWRTWQLPDEPGIKCSVMGDLQEISGAERPNKEELNKFWLVLREEGREGIENDFSDSEFVCAISFVKRRFSRYFKDFNTRNHKNLWKQEWHLQGWEVPSGVPSVSYIAAVHWLKRTLEQVDDALLESFGKQAKELTGNYGEWQTEIKCLQNKGNKYFRSLDGNVFYQSNLENPKVFSDKENEKKELLKLLKKINDTNGMKPISPFYAILMMDGDSLGIHMSNYQNHDVITQGLESFTNKVKHYVYHNDGFLIYAGGDDVLAILPVENAIPCAVELRKHYLSCFKGKVDTTLSAAIEYVHVKTPLTKILKDAHYLLDDIAKDQTGRDAIAVRVWKPGGMQLQWSQPWEVALFQDTTGNDKTYLQELVEIFRQNDADDDQFSNKFLHKIRERFDQLNSEAFDADIALGLMAMEYIQSGKTTQINKIKNAKERIEKAKDAIRPLINQCRMSIRNTGKEPGEWKRQPLSVDAALLVRFLAQKGGE